MRTVPLTRSGQIHEVPDSNNTAILEIILPDDFVYRHSNTDAHSHSDITGNAFDYEVFNCYFYNKEKNDASFCNFALDIENKVAIFYWEDNPSQYLVASANSNLSYTEILAHFSRFIEAHDGN